MVILLLSYFINSESDESINYTVFITFLTSLFSFILYVFLGIIIILPISYFIFKNQHATFIESRVIDLLTFYTVNKITKMKKLKYGISIFKENEKTKNIILLFTSLIIILLSSSFIWSIYYKMDHNILTQKMYSVSILIFMSIFIVILIIREIINLYKIDLNHICFRITWYNYNNNPWTN